MYYFISDDDLIKIETQADYNESLKQAANA